MENISEKVIGENIRNIRKQIAMTLDKLAIEVGVTKSTLSKIETGKIIPPIATLLRIANALNVKVTMFFMEKEKRPSYVVTRKNYGQIVTFDESRVGYVYEAIATNMADKLAEPYLCTIDNRDKSIEFQHPGEEFIYILSGKIEYTVGTDKLILSAGDSLYFDSSNIHHFRTLSTKPVKMLFIKINPPVRR